MIAFLFTHIFLILFYNRNLPITCWYVREKLLSMFMNIAYRAINIKNGINDDYIPENKRENIIKTLIFASFNFLIRTHLINIQLNCDKN